MPVLSLKRSFNRPTVDAIPDDNVYPVIKEVSIQGVGKASGQTLKHGTVLSRVWDADNGEYKYCPLEDWQAVISEDTGVDGVANQNDYAGILGNALIDLTRVDISSATSIIDDLVVDRFSGKFKVTYSTAPAAAADLRATYFHGGIDQKSDPVAILIAREAHTNLENFDGDAIDDEDVPVCVMGTVKGTRLIWPSTSDADDQLGFVVRMQENGLIAK